MYLYDTDLIWIYWPIIIQSEQNKDKITYLCIYVIQASVAYIDQ